MNIYTPLEGAISLHWVIQASLRNVNIRAFDPVDLRPGKYIKLYQDAANQPRRHGP